MLVELSVSNFAIIESLTLEFGPGFNVLTGETGTGKSILIDAVSLILGARASTDVMRTGCEKATVEGVFHLSPQVQAALTTSLEELGLHEDSEDLILSREVAREGRSVCRVNGHAVTLGTLREIGSHLVDIHGQGEHLSLLRVRNHVDFLDRYAGLSQERQSFSALVHELGRVRTELRSLRRDARELARRVDLLRYQIAEIRGAKLETGEEDTLRRERELLSTVEKRLQLSAQVYDLLAEGERGERSLLDLLGAVVTDTSTLADMDDVLAEPKQLAETTLYQLEDLARSMRNYRDGVEYDPERLRAVEDRLDLIHGLKRKYGDSVEEILAFAQRAEEELNSISQGEERVEELEEEEKRLLARIAASGQTLSQARQVAAERLCTGMESELAELNMESARFSVDLHWVEAEDGVEVEGKRYQFDATGLDRVEFLISPNPGEGLKPLARIASGGETSRLMLAMKRALSAADPVPTLIFDEIDAGIGGRTGSIVGRKLWALSRDHQVLCVTHLAQMACYSDQHFRLTKDVVDGRTVSLARKLSYVERVEELAILLGGAVTEATRRSAAELIRRVSHENAIA